jgi:hypothetical protein
MDVLVGVPRSSASRSAVAGALLSIGNSVIAPTRLSPVGKSAGRSVQSGRVCVPSRDCAGESNRSSGTVVVSARRCAGRGITQFAQAATAWARAEAVLHPTIAGTSWISASLVRGSTINDAKSRCRVWLLRSTASPTCWLRTGRPWLSPSSRSLPRTTFGLMASTRGPGAATLAHHDAVLAVCALPGSRCS